MEDYSLSIEKIILIIIAGGLIFGISIGIGTNIPTEKDALLIIWEELKGFILPSTQNSIWFISLFDIIVKFLIFLLILAPLLFAISLGKWGLFLLINSFLLGIMLGIATENAHIVILLLILFFMFLLPLICSKIIGYNGEY